MSMKWVKTDSDGHARYLLMDSMDNEMAEVVEVEKDEWHFDILGFTAGVEGSKEDAMLEVFHFLGIRPMR